MEPAPEIPSAESMKVDLDFFAGTAPGKAGSHFGVAATTATLVSATTILVLSAPRLAFLIAINDTPARIGDGVWEWVHDFPNGVDRYRLRGSTDGDDVVWEFHLTSAELDDVLWFNGRSTRGAAEGYWEFHAFNEKGNPIAGRVDYDFVGADRTLDLTALLGANAGDTLTFTVSGDDRAIDFFDASTSNTADIRWNIQTMSGSIQSPNYNGGERGCWDENRSNTDCATS